MKKHRHQSGRWEPRQRRLHHIPKKVAPAKESQRIETVEWIKSRKPEHFTLQLAAMSSEQAVKELIKKQSQAGSFAYYRKNQKGKLLYIAIYGSFANRTAAEEAATLFVPLKPWIRDFGSIQEILSKRIRAD